uniref:C-type lectin domain-containing protein n=1 Tax=Scophthalmus maximus TaxID=52904 RepID=A0A8D3AE51_SCOMX
TFYLMGTRFGRQTGLPMLIGFLGSNCGNIALTVLESGASIDTSSPGQQLNSVQKRYIQLCKDPSTPPWQCSEWIHVGGPCYYFSKMTSMESLRSRDSCAEMGGHLTTLHTIEQHMYTAVIYSSACLSHFSVISPCHRYWDHHSKTCFKVPCVHIYELIRQINAIQLNRILIQLKMLYTWKSL